MPKKGKEKKHDHEDNQPIFGDSKGYRILKKNSEAKIVQNVDEDELDAHECESWIDHWGSACYLVNDFEKKNYIDYVKLKQCPFCGNTANFLEGAHAIVKPCGSNNYINATYIVPMCHKCYKNNHLKNIMEVLAVKTTGNMCASTFQP